MSLSCLKSVFPHCSHVQTPVHGLWALSSYDLCLSLQTNLWPSLPHTSQSAESSAPAILFLIPQSLSSSCLLSHEWLSWPTPALLLLILQWTLPPFYPPHQKSYKVSLPRVPTIPCILQTLHFSMSSPLPDWQSRKGSLFLFLKYLVYIECSKCVKYSISKCKNWNQHSCHIGQVTKWPDIMKQVTFIPHCSLNFSDRYHHPHLFSGDLERWRGLSKDTGAEKDGALFALVGVLSPKSCLCNQECAETTASYSPFSPWSWNLFYLGLVMRPVNRLHLS